MSLDAQNFYERLGVEKTADERTIKRAYFTLVRKFPPETHPEEFKRLREAYEVLSDADARKEYDSVGELDQHGSEVGAQLRAAMEAMDQGLHKEAQAMLVAVLAAKPDLHFARDMLGMSYLNNKQFDSALAVFATLSQQVPNNAAYQLHFGYALHAKKDLAGAMRAYERARAIDGTDVRVMVAMSDCLVDQKQFDAASKLLDDAINADGTVDFKDFGLFVRKLEIEIERQRPGGVQSVLTELLKVVPPEPEAKAYVANRLSSLAASLFALKRPEEANLLMREASALDPNRATGEYPKSVVVHIEDLPESSRLWLKEQNEQKAPGKVSRSKYPGSVFAILGAGAAFFMFVVVPATTPRPLDAGNLAFIALVSVLSFILAAWGIWRFREVWKNPYGAYAIVHPLYLLEVKVEQVTAYPLVNLHNVKVTHRSTNGVYNGTTVDLQFAGNNFSCNIYGQQNAVDWAEAVLDKKRRMLELMYAGHLESQVSNDPVSSLIPSALIRQKPADRKPSEAELASKSLRNKGFIAAAVLGVVVTAAIVPIHARYVEENVWSRTRYSYDGDISAYVAYLKEYPTGRHADAAKKAITERYDKALALVQGLPESDLKPALLEMLQVFKDKNDPQVDVVFESEAAFAKLELPEKLANEVVNPRDAFTASANSAREYRMTTSLEDAFRKLLGTRLISFTRSSGKAPVRFTVRYKVGLTKAIYESAKPTGNPARDKKFLGIWFDWNFGVVFPPDDTPKYKFALESEPAKDIRWTSSRYERDSPTLPYDKMAESAFDDFEVQLGKQFGTHADEPAEDDEALDADEEAKAAAEMRRRLDEILKHPPKAPLRHK